MRRQGNDEFHSLRTSYLKLRAALRDPATGLYAFPLHFDEIRALLSSRTRIGTLWVGLGDRRLIESVYGWETYDRVLVAAGEYLDRARSMLLPEGTIVSIAGVRADAFTIFVSSDAAGRELTAESLLALASTLKDGLEDSLSLSSDSSAPLSRTVRVGAAMLLDSPFHRFERCVYGALDEARAHAEKPRETERLTWLAELQRLVRDEDVSSVYQPLVDLETGETVAMEAYSRGPKGSALQMPRVMFSVGRDAGLVGELDRVCRQRAIASFKGFERAPLLFLNATAESLVDPDWHSPRTFEALERVGLDPSRVVLDISESEIGPDPLVYREAIESLKQIGYRLSIDNIGSGSRSALIVEKLRPAFVKFDLTLVRGLGSEQMRLELVRSLVRLAERAGARFVAERIETAEERQSLLDCGARWGQGYYFAAESNGGELPNGAGKAKR